MQTQRWFTIAVALASSGLAACSSLLFGVANVPTYFASHLRARDIDYGSQARQQLDIYAPAQAQNAPVVVFWHGGSWATGDKADYRFVGDALAKRGYVVVLPNYRLHPSVKFPAFMDDAAAAVAWLQQHARDYGGDPRRMVLMGHSAGAQIATLLGYNRDYLRRANGQPEFIRGVIGLSGPYALDPNSDLLNAIFASPYAHKDWQPLAFADADAPPTLLMHGRKDDVVYPGHAEQLRDALQRAGAHVETEFYDAGHSATVASFAWVTPTRVPVIERTVRFIEAVTAGADTESRGSVSAP